MSRPSAALPPRSAPGKPATSAGLRELRRGQILIAARRIVATEGLDALTFNALEDALDFSRGVITYHFADKEELVEALLFHAVDEIDAGTDLLLERSASMEEKVRAILASKVRGFLEKEEASRVLLSFWARAGRDDRAREVNRALFTRYRAESASLVKAARKDKPKLSLDAQGFAALLVGAVIGLVVQRLVEPGAFPLEAALDEAARACASRLRG